ncbi:MAG: hypothetical protein AB7N80_15545 [Bdellovibrionales bacterium]
MLEILRMFLVATLLAVWGLKQISQSVTAELQVQMSAFHFP